ncbi:hypothetical protein Clacol_009610 [Clathrus columnatus]|uniref:Uncharacterized protein n=1 Tax=Clathrus columnatus TaxID=1419009 RepID=A0AAV5AQ97_9AGAM|nr:hypothetical protein Clacol_009610 [Clathrus columnatus]
MHNYFKHRTTDWEIAVTSLILIPDLLHYSTAAYMTAEVPTGVIHITNVAYPTQYIDIRFSKDGGELIGWAKGSSKQVNQSWLLKPLGNASYHLIGFVPGGRGRPAKLAYVTPDRAPGVSLEAARLRANSTTNKPGIFNVHYNEKHKAWQ